MHSELQFSRSQCVHKLVIVAHSQTCLPHSIWEKSLCCINNICPVCNTARPQLDTEDVDKSTVFIGTTTCDNTTIVCHVYVTILSQ